MRAEKLLNGLGGEKISWGKKLEDLNLESLSILGDVILSAGFIAYLGAFPSNYREFCISNWKDLLKKNNILLSKNYSL